MRIRWVLPSSVVVSGDTLDYPAAKVCASDEEVQTLLRAIRRNAGDHCEQLHCLTNPAGSIEVSESQNGLFFYHVVRLTCKEAAKCHNLGSSYAYLTKP